MLRAALLLPFIALAACGSSNPITSNFSAPTLPQARPGDPRTNAAVAQACREQSARELQRQDRSMLLREDESNSRTGASFGGQPATNQTDVLARQFLLDRRVNECIRANTRDDASVQPAPAAATPPPPPAPAARGSRVSRPGA